MLVVWSVPAVLLVSLGGLVMALILTFPVRLLSRVMPRALAILCAFLILLAVVLLIAYVFAPVLLTQITALIRNLPGFTQNLEQFLTEALQALNHDNLLPSPPEVIVNRLGKDLQASLSVITGNMLNTTVGLVFSTFSLALSIFAITFVAASLLANVRSFKVAFIMAAPRRYRHDARALWQALAHALSHYLGGLALILVIQGVLSAIALSLIGVPYALALGAWVSITAVIPYLGAWIGAIPALLVAFSISPTVVGLTAIVFLAIQQLEGNVLTPRIQSQTIRVPAVLVFLAIIAGGGLWGLIGVLLAVPTLAVCRVLFDFFRVRLRVDS